LNLLQQGNFNVLGIYFENVRTRNVLSKLLSAREPWIIDVIYKAIEIVLSALRAVWQRIEESTDLLLRIYPITWTTLWDVSGLIFS